MANRLATAVLAAAFAVSTMAAHGAGMPDTGTMNFVPGGDAPSYLVNENLAVTPGSAGQSPLGTAFNQTAGPADSAAAPEPAVRTTKRRHGRLAAGHTSRHHAAANARTRHHAQRVAGTRTVRQGKSASLRNIPRPVRTVRQASSPARRETARRAKASPRHAAAKSAAPRG
jgi:hypothetical protein